jgi:uncharacterized membrane protein
MSNSEFFIAFVFVFVIFVVCVVFLSNQVKKHHEKDNASTSSSKYIDNSQIPPRENNLEEY